MSHDRPGASPPRPISMETLDRYLAAEATVGEADQVHAWLGDDEGHIPVSGVRWNRDAAVTGMREYVERYGTANANDVVVRRLADINTLQVPRNRPNSRHRHHAFTQRSIGSRVRAYGALLTISIAAVLGGVYWQQHTSGERTARVYETAMGERVSITLADGSRITLAPQSRLAVPSTFGRTDRAVTLSGRGDFDVPSSEQKPFTIRTGDVITTVLGTRFDVQHYPNDAAVRVAVTSGRVMAYGRRSRVTIPAGSSAQLTDSTATTTPIDDRHASTDWVDGRLRFNATPVSAMLATLSRWYGYQFQLTDSTLAHELVRVEFRTDAPDATLRILKRVLDVTMTFDGPRITLSPNHAGAGVKGRTRVVPTVSPLPFEAGK
jgi:ferric-dicitrate binding protein FerR (iron transport regulator)